MFTFTEIMQPFSINPRSVIRTDIDAEVLTALECQVGQWGGFTGVGVKTIVPGKAAAKVACRLVPDQDPEEILQASKSL